MAPREEGKMETMRRTISNKTVISFGRAERVQRQSYVSQQSTLQTPVCRMSEYII